MSDTIIAAIITGVFGLMAVGTTYFLTSKSIKKTLQKEEIDTKDTSGAKIYDNLRDAFDSLYDELNIIHGKKHIHKLRIYGSKSASISSYFFDNNDLTIDECIVMLRKLPQGHDLFREEFEKERETQKIKWEILKNIKKLSLVEYDRFSDMWYAICDDKVLITDLFTLEFCGDENMYTPYILQENKAIMVLPCCTEPARKQILRYISHFDRNLSYYQDGA